MTPMQFENIDDPTDITEEQHAENVRIFRKLIDAAVASFGEDVPEERRDKMAEVSAEVTRQLDSFEFWVIAGLLQAMAERAQIAELEKNFGLPDESDEEFMARITQTLNEMAASSEGTERSDDDVPKAA